MHLKFCGMWVPVRSRPACSPCRRVLALPPEPLGPATPPHRCPAALRHRASCPPPLRARSGRPRPGSPPPQAPERGARIWSRAGCPGDPAGRRPPAGRCGTAGGRAFRWNHRPWFAKVRGCEVELCMLTARVRNRIWCGARRPATRWRCANCSTGTPGASAALVRRRLSPALQRKVSVSDIVQETRIAAFGRSGAFEDRGDGAFVRGSPASLSWKCGARSGTTR